MSVKLNGLNMRQTFLQQSLVNQWVFLNDISHQTLTFPDLYIKTMVVLISSHFMIWRVSVNLNNYSRTKIRRIFTTILLSKLKIYIDFTKLLFLLPTNTYWYRNNTILSERVTTLKLCQNHHVPWFYGNCKQFSIANNMFSYRRR